MSSLLRVRAPAATRGELPLAVGLIVSLAWFALVPVGALALLGLVAFAALAWRRLDLALCLLPLAFPYWYVPRPLVGGAVFPLSEVAIVICLMVALARSAVGAVRALHGRAAGQWAAALGVRLRRRARVLYARLGPWIVSGAALLVLGAAIGVVIARQPHDALRAFRWEVAEPLLYLALVVIYVRRRERARLLVWAFLGSALLVAALADAQVLWLHISFTPLAQGNRLVPYTGSGLAGRATGIIYGSGNSLGAWLERALPPALALAIAAWGLSRRERLLALGCALFFVPPLLWSDSRGAEVGVLLACLLVLVLAKSRLWVAGIVCGALGLLLVIWQRAALTAALLHGHGGSGEVRLLIWLAAVRMLRDHPIFGIGPDQFLYYYSGLYTSHPYWVTRYNGQSTLWAINPTLSHPHNLLLDLWLSVGLAGLVGFALVVVALWRRVGRLWRTSRVGPWPAVLALGVAASVLAGIIHGMVDSAYFEPDLALAFWWAVAVLVTLERGSRRPRPLLSRRR